MSRSSRTARLVLVLALAVLAAPAGVGAKEAGQVEVLELTNEPADAVAGRTWTAELRIRPRELAQRASVLIVNERTGEQRSFAARRGEEGFVADVVFPEEGRWAYGVASDGRLVAGREYVEVTEARARSDAAPILGVSAFLVLGAMVLAVSALRHRPVPVGDRSTSG